LKRVILQDVAAACGLSRSTVSLVAQDSPRASEQTKARVRKVMAELGYVYDRGAANLRTGRSMMVGLIMTDVRNPYFADLTMAVEQGLRAAGYTLLQGYSYDERARQERLISTVVEHRADGVILLPAIGSDAGELRRLARPQGTPAVLIARSIKGLDADYTSVDNVAAGELLGEHLRDLGARSVAFVGGPAGPAGSTGREGRYAGLARALKRGGIALSARGRHTSPATATDGERITHELLGNENPPDVIVAYSDAVAMGVLHALRDRGLRAGADIAVAGFDDVAEARYASPPLTSVATFPGETGALAARLLLARMADPQRPSESSIIAPRLHIRESTASFTPDTARLLTVSARPR
jgi:LacI family transcriptional regulator